jgi:excisionase family DNA binding protein
MEPITSDSPHHAPTAAPAAHRPPLSRQTTWPVLFTVDEVADLLRTTRRAIYAMIARRQLPGVVRIRRRVLVRADDLLHWLDQKRASSPKE